MIRAGSGQDPGKYLHGRLAVLGAEAPHNVGLPADSSDTWVLERINAPRLGFSDNRQNDSRLTSDSVLPYQKHFLFRTP